MRAAPSVNRASHGSAGQFTSPAADLEEQVVEYQAELDVIVINFGRDARQVRADIAADERDDIERFRHYQAVERAIREADTVRQLAAFHALVAHVEADELREDERRRGRIPALALLASKITRLRRIFHTDFAPLILREFASRA